MVHVVRTRAFKLAALILTCTAIASMLVGCLKPSNETKNEKKDEISVYVGSEPEDGFDPCTGWGTTGYMIFQSGLLKFDHNLNLGPDLATEWNVSSDGLTYTYKLAPSIKFSDGTDFGAHDVAFTYETAKKSGSEIDLTMLKKVEAPDASTVIFTLSKPHSTFLTTTAQIGIVPKASYSAEAYRENPVGTGPFKLVQWDKGQQVILEPNEHYYGRKSEFKKINLLFLENETALANAKAGKLDVVMVDPEYAKESVDDMSLVTFPTVDNRGISLPVVPQKKDGDKTVGNDVTSDPAVRKALKIGIDRQRLIADALNDIGTPAFTRVDQLPWYNPDTIYADKRADEAKKLLDDAGWKTGTDGVRIKDGVKAEFSIMVAASDTQRYNLVVAFAEQAKELGVEVKPLSSSWDDIYKDGYHNPVLWGFGDYNPIDLHYGYYTGSQYNFSGYSNKTVDNYIDKALEATDENTAVNSWKSAQWDGKTGPESENGETPYIWLVNIDHCYFVAEGLNLGDQPIHPHGHGWPVLCNLNEWTWN